MTVVIKNHQLDSPPFPFHTDTFNSLILQGLETDKDITTVEFSAEDRPHDPYIYNSKAGSNVLCS